MARDPYNVATLDQALARLGPALEILDGFAHRNKNQHRVSGWWAQFDMLRRNARKLALDLQASARAARPERKKKKSLALLAEADERVRRRAGHVRQHLVPRAYLAFTQLASDNQHAQLGLALLGVLAQVDHAAGLLVPRETTPPREETREERAGLDREARADGGAKPTLSVEVETTDVGVAVSRADLGGDDPDTLRAATRVGEQERRTTVSPGGASRTVKTSAKKPGKKRNKEPGDEFDQLFGSHPKRPKKKRKNKDEFDDLFGSLS